MPIRSKTLARIALAIYAVLALVPGAGVVLCLASDGTHFGIGVHDGCPHPPDPDGTHPPCVDVHLDGMRDLLPDAMAVPQPEATAWLALADAMPRHTLPRGSTGEARARAGPGEDAEPPHLTRALQARAVVVLLI